MGNYRFRLSDMIPNAWFYKLKDMSRSRNHHMMKTSSSSSSNPTNKKHNTTSSSSSTSFSSSSSFAQAQNNNHPSKIITTQKQLPHLSDQRKSYYFSRDLSTPHPNSPIINKPTKALSPPRKSSRRRRSTKRNRPRPPPRVVSSSISAGCSCRATLESVRTKPLDEEFSSSDHDSVLTEYGSDRGLSTDTFDGMLSWSTSCTKCTSENDIILTMDDVEDGVSELDSLPPIITKKKHDAPTKIQRTSAEFSERNAYGSLSVKVVKEDIVSGGNNWSGGKYQGKTTTTPVKRAGVKLRTNSPRINVNRGVQRRKSVSSSSSSGSRLSASESLAVVKTSKDPGRDFRESMVEMIVENNIRASRDLEELLACYLSLNSDEYHDLIINVFKQIWFDFIHVRLN